MDDKRVMGVPIDWQRAESWLVHLIALHSFVIGLFLMFLTRWGTAFGGWPEVTPLFFARQAGAFHVVVGTGYLLEYFHHATVRLLLVTKSVALVFRISMTILDSAPWAVPLSAVGDGLMGLAVLVVHGKVVGERRGGS